MDPEVRTLVDISETPAALESQADIVLERAKWAAEIFQRYDRDMTMNIVNNVAKVAYQNADKYANWAVEETGFGVAAHKKIKNELTTFPLVEFYQDKDFVNTIVDKNQKIVKIPRPAGVIIALVPSTNPIATINYKTILSLMTRNAIVISPHPAARACSVDATYTLIEAALDAGAPAGSIQIIEKTTILASKKVNRKNVSRWGILNIKKIDKRNFIIRDVIEKPTIPLIEELMKSSKTSVTLATGGSAMVRSAYSSSNPAIGVGPGNAPVYVDLSADLEKAAKNIIESKSFDNSVLCTSESVLITLKEIDKRLKQSFRQAGAYICNEDDVIRLRRYLFQGRGFNLESLGRDALWIANECGIRVPDRTLILLAPIKQIGVEEPLSQEKLCPVLAYHVVNNLGQAIAQARAVLRISGIGHSAAIHSKDEKAIFSFANAVEVYRVVVNVPCAQGAAGFNTSLAPAFTVGTGYLGSSSVGEHI